MAQYSQVSVEYACSNEKCFHTIRFFVVKVEYFLDPVGSIKMRHDISGTCLGSFHLLIHRTFITLLLLFLQKIQSKSRITFLAHVVKCLVAFFKRSYAQIGLLIEFWVVLVVLGKDLAPVEEGALA